MENFHIIKITYLGATNTKGSRVKMYSERFKQTKVVSWDYQLRDKTDIATKYLKEKGFDIVGQAEGTNCNYIITNTFASIK